MLPADIERERETAIDALNDEWNAPGCTMHISVYDERLAAINRHARERRQPAGEKTSGHRMDAAMTAELQALEERIDAASRRGDAGEMLAIIMDKRFDQLVRKDAADQARDAVEECDCSLEQVLGFIEAERHIVRALLAVQVVRRRNMATRLAAVERELQELRKVADKPSIAVTASGDLHVAGMDGMTRAVERQTVAIAALDETIRTPLQVVRADKKIVGAVRVRSGSDPIEPRDQDAQQLAVIEDLVKRVQALEARRPLQYMGVWREGAYAEGSMVTDHGSTWIAKQDTSRRPGADRDSWQLTAKGFAR